MRKKIILRAESTSITSLPIGVNCHREEAGKHSRPNLRWTHQLASELISVEIDPGPSPLFTARFNQSTNKVLHCHRRGGWNGANRLGLHGSQVDHKTGKPGVPMEMLLAPRRPLPNYPFWHGFVDNKLPDVAL